MTAAQQRVEPDYDRRPDPGLDRLRAEQKSPERRANRESAARRPS
ncbi:hypothetical protein [Catenuloplanes japonicus]|nr:hypothetical protein [Catenuloplanes japonicus]